MTITLSPEVEQRLQDAAIRKGVAPDQLAVQLLDKALPIQVAREPDLVTLALLEQWDRDDQTDDPEELARREQEFEEFKRAMNQNRLDSEGPNARVPFP